MYTQSRNDSEAALAQGKWVKLICGASNQDLPAIGDLCALYAKAGVHCIDVAADLAVINAAQEALDWVQETFGKRPWLMISLSDGIDDHFRKASFNPLLCPANCPRPCQQICPAAAISEKGGVNPEKCYGCGRCLPQCPLGLINENHMNLKLNAIAPLLEQAKPDAVEIHTAPGRSLAFQALLNELMNSNIAFKRIAVSCGLQNHGITIEQLAQELWVRYNHLRQNDQKLLWQIDGRQMSGDLGRGTAKVAVSLWEKLRPLAPPGPLQLAGGTNGYTIRYLPSSNGPAGIAFGGKARKIIQPWLMEAQTKQIKLRDWPEGWQKALESAQELIQPWLSRNSDHCIC